MTCKMHVRSKCYSRSIGACHKAVLMSHSLNGSMCLLALSEHHTLYVKACEKQKDTAARDTLLACMLV